MYLFLLVGLALLWVTPCSVLAEATQATGLTLRQAIDAALAGNPELRSFAFKLRAQDARIGQAGLRPAPEFSVTVEDVLGTGVAQGIDAAQATFALSQVIELGGKRDRRVDAAASARDLLGVENQARQLDVLAEVARRFIHVAADQEQLALTRLATTLAEQTLVATEQRVTAAKAPEVERRRARISLARARVAEEHAEHELQSSRRKLAALWGETEPRYMSVTADLYRLPRPADFTALADLLEHNPDTLRFASEARLRDAEIRLAEARARADVTFSAGVRRLQETQDQVFVFGVSIPLFGAPRAHSAITEAQTLRGQTDAERAAHGIRVRTQLFELYQELKHAITETTMLREQVLPEMAAVMKETRYAFERGRYSYLEWVDAQRERVAVQRALIEAASNAQLYQVEIERLTGTALPTAALTEQP